MDSKGLRAARMLLSLALAGSLLACVAVGAYAWFSRSDSAEVGFSLSAQPDRFLSVEFVAEEGALKDAQGRLCFDGLLPGGEIPFALRVQSRAGLPCTARLCFEGITASLGAEPEESLLDHLVLTVRPNEGYVAALQAAGAAVPAEAVVPFADACGSAEDGMTLSVYDALPIPPTGEESAVYLQCSIRLDCETPASCMGQGFVLGTVRLRV